MKIPAISFGVEVLKATKFTANHAIDNSNSGKVMEKVGFHYIHGGQYAKIDGSVPFDSKCYILEL